MSDLAPGTHWAATVAHRYLWAHERAYRTTAWVSASALAVLLVSGLVLLLSPRPMHPTGGVAPTATGAATPVDDLKSLARRAASDPAAFASLEHEANAGNAQAQYIVGALYDPFVPALHFNKDPAKAFEWYQKAAVQNYPPAENNLGVCYAKGVGVERNLTEAVRWYRQAAETGWAQAQSNLGRAYETGEGMDRDYGQALVWYHKAADQGLASAQLSLGLAYEQGNGVDQDYALAASWFEKAAVQGYPPAEYDLGAAYAKGQGVTQDMAQAEAWYRKAAAHGDRPAQEALRALQSPAK